MKLLLRQMSFRNILRKCIKKTRRIIGLVINGWDFLEDSSLLKTNKWEKNDLAAEFWDKTPWLSTDLRGWHYGEQEDLLHRNLLIIRKIIPSCRQHFCSCLMQRNVLFLFIYAMPLYVQTHRYVVIDFLDWNVCESRNIMEIYNLKAYSKIFFIVIWFI